MSLVLIPLRTRWTVPLSISEQKAYCSLFCGLEPREVSLLPSKLQRQTLRNAPLHQGQAMGEVEGGGVKIA